MLRHFLLLFLDDGGLDLLSHASFVSRAASFRRIIITRAARGLIRAARATRATPSGNAIRVTHAHRAAPRPRGAPRSALRGAKWAGRGWEGGRATCHRLPRRGGAGRMAAHGASSPDPNFPLIFESKIKARGSGDAAEGWPSRGSGRLSRGCRWGPPAVPGRRGPSSAFHSLPNSLPPFPPIPIIPPDPSSQLNLSTPHRCRAYRSLPRPCLALLQLHATPP